MKKPSLKEVREHFKDAKIVKELRKSGIDRTFDLSKYDLSTIEYNVFDNICIGDNYFYLFNSHNYNSFKKGYAEIIEYKNDKPKQYKKGIDTMCRAESNMTLKERLGAVKWNIDKYNWRDKGQDREDFIKIKAYCDYAIKQLDNERKQ